MTAGTDPSSQPTPPREPLGRAGVPRASRRKAEQRPQEVILILPRVRGAYGIKGKLIGQRSARETKPARAPQPRRQLYLAGAHLGSDAPREAPALSEVPPSCYLCPPSPCHLCPQPPDTGEQVINSQTKAGICRLTRVLERSGKTHLHQTKGEG